MPLVVVYLASESITILRIKIASVGACVIATVAFHKLLHTVFYIWFLFYFLSMRSIIF